METEFTDLVQKFHLAKKLEEGNKDAIDYVMNEMSRLESIIRDYEIGLKQAKEKLDSVTFKKPAPKNNIKTFINM